MATVAPYPADLAHAAAQAYRRPIRIAAAVLSGYYALLACLHPMVLQPPVAGPLMGAAAGLCVAFAAIAWFLRRRQIGYPVLEALVLLGACAVTCKVLLHAGLARDPAQILYLPTVALAFGFLAPTVRTALACIAMASLAALGFTLVAAPDMAVMATAITLTTSVVAGLGAQMMHRSLARRMAENRRTRQLLRDLRRARLEADAQAARAADASHAKSAFLANMSHELRTPLNGILAVAATLEQELAVPRHRDMAGLIASSGRTLTALIGSVLDLSKIEAERLELVEEPFAVSETLVPQLELLRAQALAKGLALSVTVTPPARARFLGDPVRIQQITGNIVTNAIKFTARGSVRVRVDWSADTGLLDITVRDTGPGLTPELTARLFQRFSQADATSARRHGGAGLGLAIVKGLVDLMGGDVGVESTPGAGCLVSVSLPLVWLGAETAGAGTGPAAPRLKTPPSPAPIREVPATPGPVAQEAVRILLAEDHPANRRVVELVLEPLGVVLTCAQNGVEAVEAWKSAHFDVVLMDMQMPEMDGLDATRTIRRLEASGGRPRVPVIMLTANAMAEHRRWSEEAGADLHVSKPFTPTQLIGAIESVLEAAGDGATPSGATGPEAASARA